MEETSDREELPNFSISIDFLGPDPTKSKNKAKKNMQVSRFANLSKDQLQQDFGRKTFTGSKKSHQLVINNI